MTPKNSLEELQSIVAHMNKRLNILENRVSEMHLQYYKDKAVEYQEELKLDKDWEEL